MDFKFRFLTYYVKWLEYIKSDQLETSLKINLLSLLDFYKVLYSGVNVLYKSKLW